MPNHPTMSNSLKQYIEIFDSHRSAIDAHAPAFLNKLREKAAETLKEMGRLPVRGDEGYPKISLDEMFAPDYGLNISRVEFPAHEQVSGCDQSITGRPAAMLVNDSFARCAAALPEGVELMSLGEAAAKYPEYFEHEIAPAHNPIVAINSLLAQDGIFIRIKAGAQVARPLQILAMFNSSQPMMGVRRVRIVAEEGSKSSVLLCEHPLDGAKDNLSCRVVEVSVAQNASFNFYDMEEAGEASRRASVFASEQQSGSRLAVSALFLNGGMTRNEYYPKFLGQHCEVRLGGMVIGSGEQIVDNSVFIDHDQPYCTSEQLFKYALFDAAQGSFEGLVKVAHGAEHTSAHQSNRNLLGSDKARMYAMPQLEIYCDEVKASHGSATGQLDERALFYMRQRGIPEAEARMMLVNAFMTDVLDSIDDDQLRERLRHLVDLRLRGAETVCAGCK